MRGQWNFPVTGATGFPGIAGRSVPAVPAAGGSFAAVPPGTLFQRVPFLQKWKDKTGDKGQKKCENTPAER